MRPQIVPTASNGVDAVNFRQMRESNSLHLEKQHVQHPPPPSPRLPHSQHSGGSSVRTPGTPGLHGDDGMEPPTDADLFGAFSSMTIQYDGESLATQVSLRNASYLFDDIGTFPAVTLFSISLETLHALQADHLPFHLSGSWICIAVSVRCSFNFLSSCIMRLLCALEFLTTPIFFSQLLFRVFHLSVIATSRQGDRSH